MEEKERGTFVPYLLFVCALPGTALRVVSKQSGTKMG